MKICFVLEKMAEGFRDQCCECKHPHIPERDISTPWIFLSWFGTGQFQERLSLDGDRGAVRYAGGSWGPKVRRS